MGTLFENRTIMNENLTKEMYRYYHFKLPIYIVIDVFMGLSFLANLAALLLEGKCNYSVFFLVPAFVLFQSYLYDKNVKTQLRRDNELYCGMPIEVQMIVTGEYVKAVKANGTSNEVSFSNIKRAVQTKNLIFLESEAKLIYVFRKDSFVKGTAEEMISFLKGKGIKVRRG